MLDDAKIYRAEDPFKSERIKQLFADAPDILGFWTKHFHECLDAEVRDDVKRILLEARPLRGVQDPQIGLGMRHPLHQDC